MNQVILTCPSCKRPEITKDSSTDSFYCTFCTARFTSGSLYYEQLNNKYKKYQPEEPKQELPTRCPNCNKSLVEETTFDRHEGKSRRFVCDQCKWEYRVFEQEEEQPEEQPANKITPSHKFTPRANSIQHGGTHYKTKTIEPWDYVIANNLGFLEGNAIKYITRHKDKNGIDDIKKAIHYLQKLLEVLEN